MDLEITPELVAAIGDNLIRISNQYNRPIGAGMYYFVIDCRAYSCPLQLLALDNNQSHGSDLRFFIPLIFTAGFDGVKFEGSDKWWWELGDSVYKYLLAYTTIYLSFSCVRRPLEQRLSFLQEDGYSDILNEEY